MFRSANTMSRFPPGALADIGPQRTRARHGCVILRHVYVPEDAPRHDAARRASIEMRKLKMKRAISNKPRAQGLPMYGSLAADVAMPGDKGRRGSQHKQGQRQ